MPLTVKYYSLINDRFWNTAFKPILLYGQRFDIESREASVANKYKTTGGLCPCKEPVTIVCPLGAWTT